MAGLNKYQAYPEYRDSGVEWCNELPLNWKKTNLRWLSNIFAGGTPSKNVIDYWENGTVPWISSGAVNQGYVVEPSTYISKAALENSSAKWIPKGALVVALAGQGKTKGMVAQLGINTTCNQSMAAIVLYKKNQSRYIFWWLISNYQNIRNMAGGDLRDGLNLELLGDIQCPQPSNDESSKIALFLDHETAKIDNLIEKQQQLIELLKEKRQAVISHAVTKGLNPDVPMKDSGVDWLGKIPSHWEMKKLAYLGSARNGLTYSPESITDNESGILVLRSSNIQHSCLSFDDNVYVKTIIPEQFLVKENDLLICSRNGSRNLIGKNAIINKEAEGMAFGAFMAIFRSNINKYLFWVLNSTLFDYQSGSFLTSTINQLTIGNLNSMEVPVPPSKEQKEIESHLSKKNYDFIELISNVHSNISLLLERRTALISAAVTGKIDLRNWTAPIPEAETPTEASA